LNCGYENAVDVMFVGFACEYCNIVNISSFRKVWMKSSSRKCRIIIFVRPISNNHSPAPSFFSAERSSFFGFS
jgi:hypothetical protein